MLPILAPNLSVSSFSFMSRCWAVREHSWSAGTGSNEIARSDCGLGFTLTQGWGLESRGCRRQGVCLVTGTFVTYSCSQINFEAWLAERWWQTHIRVSSCRKGCAGDLNCFGAKNRHWNNLLKFNLKDVWWRSALSWISLIIYFLHFFTFCKLRSFWWTHRSKK